MARGKQGFYLEAWKFGVYVIIPITASWYYSDPGRRQKAAEYWKYIQYPASPNVGLKQQVLDMAKQQEQRKAYRQQLQELNRQAQRTEQNEQQQPQQQQNGSSTTTTTAPSTAEANKQQQGARRWLRWIGL